MMRSVRYSVQRKRVGSLNSRLTRNQLLLEAMSTLYKELHLYQGQLLQDDLLPYQILPNRAKTTDILLYAVIINEVLIHKDLMKSDLLVLPQRQQETISHIYSIPITTYSNTTCSTHQATIEDADYLC